MQRPGFFYANTIGCFSDSKCFSCSTILSFNNDSFKNLNSFSVTFFDSKFDVLNTSSMPIKASGNRGPSVSQQVVVYHRQSLIARGFLLLLLHCFNDDRDDAKHIIIPSFHADQDQGISFCQSLEPLYRNLQTDDVPVDDIRIFIIFAHMRRQ